MNIFEEKYWEQRYFDLWTITHFLSGMGFAFLPWIMGLHLYQAFIIIVIIASLWEIAETEKKVREYTSNRFADILVAILGTYLTYLIIETLGSSAKIMWFPIITILAWVLWGIFSYGAWISYGKKTNAKFYSFFQNTRKTKAEYSAIANNALVIHTTDL